MSQRNDNNIPNIVLDNDDIQTRRKPATNPKTTQKTTTPETTQAAPKAKTSGFMVFSTLVLYSAIGAGGYFGYQENLKNQQALAQADARIVELEKQLSATGEEMGESTVAIKVKLESLIKKTDTLWKEMDKLWASAWRRNQAEIKTLRDQSTKQAQINIDTTTSITNAANFIKEVQDKQTDAQFSIAALTDEMAKLDGLKSQMTDLSSQMTGLENKSSDRDQSQLELATSVNQLEMSVNALIERMDSLKAKPTAKVSKPTPTPAG